MSATRFHTNTKQQAKFQFYIIVIIIIVISRNLVCNIYFNEGGDYRIEFSKKLVKKFVSINVFNETQEAGYGVEYTVHRPLILNKSNSLIVANCFQFHKRGALKIPIKRTLCFLA